METTTTESTAVRAASKPGRVGRLWIPIVGIGITQMIGWGTSFTALGTPIARDLHVSRETAFGAIAAMMLVSGVIAPRFGRFIDAKGARDLMVPGMLVASVGLLVVGAAQGAWSFLFGWSLFGLAVAMFLTNAAVPALVQIAGDHSRKAVSALTILTGITSAIFLPLTEWLAAHYGWRITFLIFSLLYIVVCLPILLWVLPEGRPQTVVPKSNAAEGISWEGQLPRRWRAFGFALAALWMSTQAMVSWGFNLQVVDILTGAGLPREQVLLVWMFSGPSQAIARVGDLMSGGKSGILRMAMLSSALAPIGFVIALIFGVSASTGLALAIFFGLGQGLYAVARNILPLRLFGLGTYGATMGYFAVPLNIMSAIAPLIFSMILDRAGPTTALWVAAISGAASLLAIVLLDRLVAAVAGDTVEQKV